MLPPGVAFSKADLTAPHEELIEDHLRREAAGGTSEDCGERHLTVGGFGPDGIDLRGAADLGFPGLEALMPYTNT